MLDEYTAIQTVSRYCAHIAIYRDINDIGKSPNRGSTGHGSPKRLRCVVDTIDNRIKGLETVKITGFIRISRFRKLCTLAGQDNFESFAEKIVGIF